MGSKAQLVLRTVLLGAFVAAATAPAGAEELEWYQRALVVAAPDELGYYAHVSDGCPVAKEDVTEAIEGVLIRSRIKPIVEDYSDAEQFFLEIKMYCTELDGNDSEVIFETDVRFGFLYGNTDLVLNFDYGSLDQGNGADLLTTVRRDTEDAITDFLRANSAATSEQEQSGETRL